LQVLQVDSTVLEAFTPPFTHALAIVPVLLLLVVVVVVVVAAVVVVTGDLIGLAVKKRPEQRRAGDTEDVLMRTKVLWERIT
jgi:hypothetical protein